MLRIKPFPNCCGINVITGFGYTSIADEGWGEKRDINKITKELEVLEQNVSTGRFGASILMVILNKNQMKHLGKIFEKRKWEIACTGLYHKPHKSQLTVLIKNLRKKLRKTTEK